jgi:hypothetical protein
MLDVGRIAGSARREWSHVAVLATDEPSHSGRHAWTGASALP